MFIVDRGMGHITLRCRVSIPMAATVSITVRVGVMEAMLDAVDDTAGTEEEQRLEEGVGNQMEERRAISANTQGGNHKAKLADGRIGQHTLDVPLRYRNRL
jgi:hypothetical protein